MFRITRPFATLLNYNKPLSKPFTLIPRHISTRAKSNITNRLLDFSPKPVITTGFQSFVKTGLTLAISTLTISTACCEENKERGNSEVGKFLAYIDNLVVESSQKLKKYEDSEKFLTTDKINSMIINSDKRLQDETLYELQKSLSFLMPVDIERSIVKNIKAGNEKFILTSFYVDIRIANNLKCIQYELAKYNTFLQSTNLDLTLSVENVDPFLYGSTRSIPSKIGIDALIHIMVNFTKK